VYGPLKRELDAALQRVAVAPKDEQALRAAGDLYARLKDHARAYEFHRRALEAGGPAVSLADIALSSVVLAEDLYLSFQFDEALALLARVASLPKLPPPALGVVRKMESTIHECRGDAVTALHLLEEALRLSGSPSTGSDLLKQYDLVKRVLATSPDMPPKVADALAARQRQLAAQIVARGPWVSVWQLPQNFIPGLRSQPWHNLADPGLPPALPAAATLLRNNVKMNE
jgi:tetratricopeptide (TPR) repeat protein